MKKLVEQKRKGGQEIWEEMGSGTRFHGVGGGESRGRV